MVFWLTLFLVYGFLAVELYLLAAKRGRNRANTSDQGTLQLNWILIVGSCAVGFLVLRHIDFFQWPQTLATALLADLLLVAGIALRIWAIVHLGRFFTVDVGIQQRHRLVQDGPYRFVRHPSYTGAMLEMTGIACLTFNWLGFLVIFAGSLTAYILRISVEEKVLLANFGEDYRKYAARTKRLVPGIF